jgi:nucleotide-binding universal stress UspA family protein
VTLVLAYDGSSAARAAIRVAAVFAPAAAAVVVTVRPEPLDVPQTIAGSFEALDRVAVAEAEATAAEGAEAAGAAGLAASARVETAGGNPWRAVSRVAEETGAELIACGTRGMGAFSRMAIGSTSSGLLHHAGRPVLVAPEGDGQLTGPVVVGYDGSDSSRAAVERAARLLAARELLVVHVWESLIRHSVSGRALAALPLQEVRELTGDLDAYFRAVADDVAEEGAALAREAGAEARSRAVEAAGPAWNGLLAAARTAGASLVVAGSRGRGGLAAGILGSVSSGLVYEAAMPVLVVPPA